MTTPKRIAATLFALGILTGSAAFGADNGFYIGGSLGQARPNFDTVGAAANVGTGISSSDGIYKVFGGYQFHQYFSVEGTYINLGSYTTTTTATVEPAGWGVALVGAWPIGNSFSVLGRLGEYRMRLRLKPIDRADNSWSPSFGAGLKYDFNPKFSARGEFERIQKMGSNTNTVSTDANVYSFGLAYKF